jgi:hypothetical protein
LLFIDLGAARQVPGQDFLLYLGPDGLGAALLSSDMPVFIAVDVAILRCCRRLPAVFRPGIRSFSSFMYT